MAEDMDDITPTGDGGILKKILVSGIGNVVPSGALIQGYELFYFNYLLLQKATFYIIKSIPKIL